MAITVTNRGRKSTTAGVSATNTLTSNSFSPTGGSRLVVIAAFYGELQPAAFSVSDTFSGTGAWAKDGEYTAAKYTTWTLKVAVWSALLGGTPGSGTVTVTRDAGTVDQGFAADFVELGGVGSKVQAATNINTGTSLTLTFGGAPVSTSVAIGGILGDYPGGSTVPTGWSEIATGTEPYGRFQTGYDIDSVATAPSWTTSNADDARGAIVEYAIASAGGTTVTPGVASLSLSTFAPKANLQINGAAPTALSLSAFAPQANLRINGASPTALALSAFAPQANLRINGASPTALSLSTFAPTAGLGPLTCTPGVLALALSTFAPTVSTSGNQTATPGVLSLALATFAPQLQLTLTPSLVALTLATFAPSLGLTVPVGLVTLALSTFAPPLDFRVTPAPGALVTATFAPTIATPQTVTPGVVALVLTRYAPVITGPAAAAAPGYAFLSDEPTARASVFDSRMAIATLSDAVVGRAEVMDGGA